MNGEPAGAFVPFEILRRLESGGGAGRRHELARLLPAANAAQYFSPPASRSYIAGKSDHAGDDDAAGRRGSSIAIKRDARGVQMWENHPIRLGNTTVDHRQRVPIRQPRWTENLPTEEHSVTQADARAAGAFGGRRPIAITGEAIQQLSEK